MSLKDLDPNILLILLGSLFILIGASGKIFIEKFSVAIASKGSRLFVSILGLLMLSIGIVGPSKLFSDRIPDPSRPTQVAHVPSRPSDVPWFKKVVGTYTGIATSAGIDYPVSTTFVVDAAGNITGTYVIEEAHRMMGGKLGGSKILGLGSVEFDWNDDAGRGKLRVVFAEDLNSFTGNWGNDHQLDLNYNWNGKK